MSKEDKSIKVHQRDKVKEDLKIRDLNWTEKQKEFIKLALDKKTKLIFISGPAGSSKTLLSVYCSLHLMKEKKISEIMYIRSPVESSDSKIGFLPGDADEKLKYYNLPFADKLEELLNKGQIDVLMQQERIKGHPLSFVRGMSWNCKSIILDECFPGYEKVVTEVGAMKIDSLYYKFKTQPKKSLPRLKTFNETTKEFEWKKIVKIWSNGVKKIIRVNIGKGSIHCTPNHPFLTERGWVKAEDLNPGDVMISDNIDSLHSKKTPNEDQKQILWGSYLGNSEMGPFQLNIIHDIAQKEYCKWKAQLFNIQNLIEADPEVSFLAPPFCSPEGSFDGNKNWILANLDWRGIAAWYMDDGNLSPTKDRVTLYTYPTNGGDQFEFVKKFSLLGLKCSLRDIDFKKRGKQVKILVFDAENTKKFLENVDPYIHESMKSKASHSFDSTIPYKWNDAYLGSNQIICRGTQTLDEEVEVFDIEVKDNHNFIIAFSEGPGPVVHNCQNCTQKEIVTLMTRVGEFSKCFLLADPDQSDLTNGKSGGFERLQTLFSDEESQQNGIYSFHFTEEDIKRSELVKFVVTKLKNIK